MYSGRIVSDQTVAHPRPFDYAIVIVVLDDLSLRFIRGRGELRVQVASKHTACDWDELYRVLGIVDPLEWSKPKPFLSLADAAAALKPRMGLIQEAFSEVRCLETVRQLSEMRSYEQVVAKQLETEINRRLYPKR